MKGWISCKQRKVGFCGRHNIRGHTPTKLLGSSWPWAYGGWIYNYLCNQYVSPLMLWVWIWFRARCTTLCDKVCQWLATGRWFSPGCPVSSTNKTDRHNITEILLKVALNTIKQTNLFITLKSHFLISQWNKIPSYLNYRLV